MIGSAARALWATISFVAALFIAAGSSAAQTKYKLAYCDRATGRCQTIYFDQHTACMLDLSSARNAGRQIALHPCSKVSSDQSRGARQ